MTAQHSRAEAERLLGAGDFAGALAALESLLGTRPDDPQLNLLAGNALLALGDAEAALDHYHLALHYDPACALALRGRVQALEQLGRQERVEPAYREFLQQNPGHAEAMIGLATAFRDRGEFDEAKALLESLLQARPRDAQALNFLGLMEAVHLGRIERGEALVRRALEIVPGFDAARSNLGWILALQRRYSEGFACFDEVLSRCPQDHETRLMRAHANLMRGEFGEGWKDIEARHHSGLARKRPFAFPRWHGEHAAEKTLLVHAEQGLGDQIMYSSCVPQAMARVGRVILECEPRLVPLFQRSFAPALVRAQAPEVSASPWLREIGAVDFQIPMGSLPALFRTQWSSFPPHQGYLQADPRRVAAWRERLERLSPLLKVGISWRGGTANTRRLLRSVGLDSWAPILGLPATFVCVQYGEVEADLARAQSVTGARVMRFAEAEVDYDEMAALVCALDLLVTVCTAIVHLAGALGREAWVITPAVVEWRYLDHGESMPWYPSVRLIRQQRIGIWDPVLGEVAARLSLRISRHGFPAR
ncbi:MAG: tetratricopeptide repeat protein [Betaproteobacteria bacterium]|nr:tetratricopeptide repeat protein [Betaproteobacteria bacterium]